MEAPRGDAQLRQHATPGCDGVRRSWAGLGWVGLGWVGSDGVGFGWVGLCCGGVLRWRWVRLSWAGLGWAELSCPGGDSVRWVGGLGFDLAWTRWGRMGWSGFGRVGSGSPRVKVGEIWVRWAGPSRVDLGWGVQKKHEI